MFCLLCLQSIFLQCRSFFLDFQRPYELQLPIFKSKAFLAPMAGISDPAFRLLCTEMGAGLVVTELTSIHAIVALEKELKAKKKSITEFIEYSEKERPVSVQLFGSDIDLTVKAAKIVEPFFDIIDFNMGCPAPHITSQMAGAALLEKPNHMEELFTALVEAVDIPVTLKFRSGISSTNDGQWRQIAKIAERAGVSMITFHARTIKQGYSGKADWNLIRELRSVVSEHIPVVGNGDIRTPEDAKRMIEETGCDYVMIGRGSMGNPQLFKQINDYLKTGKYSEVSKEEKINSLFKYIKYTKKYPTIKFASIRSQAMYFTKGLVGGAELRVAIGKTTNIQELEEVVKKI